MSNLRFITLLCLIAKLCAFAPTIRRSIYYPRSLVTTLATSSTETNEPNSIMEAVASKNRGIFMDSKSLGFVTGFCGFVAQSMAVEDVEYAELPPPYVPAIFGIVLLAGVGILTASLGDVMEEEASLGLQSGAMAKKEIERSRSSYFKKK